MLNELDPKSELLVLFSLSSLVGMFDTFIKYRSNFSHNELNECHGKKVNLFLHTVTSMVKKENIHVTLSELGE